ncbi:MAG: flippase-like domain-containing protein [Deltaproteobacteria bacterium]|nr:flippase-like domain-containing protein [Deltaproteobacteria bacterium]
MKHLRRIFLVCGIGIFFVLIHQIGWATIADHFRRLGWWIFPIFAVSVIWCWTSTLAWRRILRQHRRAVGRFTLFRIRLAGDAVSTLTPVNFLGGDPFRIYLLKRYHPWTEGAASVVIDRTIHSLAILVTVLIGCTAAFWRIPNIPLNIRYGLPIVLCVASVFIGWLFVHQRRGLFGFLMHAAKRLRLRREFTAPTVTRFEELDALIADFYHKDPAGFWMAFGYHFANRFLGIVEVYLIGMLAHPQFGFIEATILAGLAPIVNFLFTFIPGAIGVLEGAYTAVLYLLHLPSAVGVTIQIVRRLRAAIWIGLGFLLMDTRERKTLLQEAHLVSSSSTKRA